MRVPHTDEVRRAKVVWLSRYRDELRRRDGIAEKLTELRASAEHLGAAPRDMPSHDGPDATRLQRSVEKVIEMQSALDDATMLCLQYRIEIAYAISKVNGPNLQEVLKRRYLLGQNNFKIAESMGLGERRISQLCHRALDQITIDQEAGDEVQA